jgi:hypothetical protein
MGFIALLSVAYRKPFRYASLLVIDSSVNTNPAAITITNPNAKAQRPDSEGHYTRISGPEATLAAAVLGGAAIILVCLLQLRSAGKIARRARLDDYEAFLLGWEQRVERSFSPDLYNTYFMGGASEFRRRAAQVRRDFKGRIEFDRLDSALSRMTTEDLLGDAAFSATKDRLMNALRALIALVQSAK